MKNRNEKTQPPKQSTEQMQLCSYLEKLKSPNSIDYYVKDSANGYEKDIKILFILESPHIDEVDNKRPLMGKAGVYVSKFLGLDEIPFGKYDKLLEKKIGILNVCNIPLQVIDKNKEDADCIRKQLKRLREDDKVNDTIASFFAEKLKKYINTDTFILCGAFAQKYFDNYITTQENNDILKKHYSGKISILKVPHPSYGHWQFVNLYKENLDKLKAFFEKYNLT